MTQQLTDLPAYRSTMDRLERVKSVSAEGEDYWYAREINEILGYPTWREFENVIERARASFTNNGIDPSHQIVLTHKMMGVGKGASARSQSDGSGSRLSFSRIVWAGLVQTNGVGSALWPRM